MRFADSERKFLFRLATSRSPENLYVYDLDAAKSAQLTHTLNPEIDPADLVDPEVVRFDSFDGMKIPAILMQPKLAAGEKAPAIVEVHGGPGGQSRLGYGELYQYLVNHGYVVLRVNNRGSGGYGKAFEKMDDQKHGEGDLQDCVWGKKYLAVARLRGP